uniref:DUF6821 domain-containing protein n=1 Tax=Nelumbo nucifera TaxID=4432 RepID=A0A822ZC52_NELNU|nr:TPA_asm: hypothetical protein HUJ06_000320 [Nelumbo nucifera]
MEKSSSEMSLDEWEVLSDDGFLDLHHHEDGGRRVLSKETAGFDPKGVLDMNYFICPSPPPRHMFESSKKSSDSKGVNQLVPVPIKLEPPIGNNQNHEFVKEILDIPVVEFSIIPAAVSEKIKAPILGPKTADQDTVSQVFFKKMKEHEFVDMKLDSPKSSTKGSRLQTEVGSTQFEKEEACEGESTEHKASGKVVTEEEKEKKDNFLDPEIKNDNNWEDSAGGLCIWKWRLTGIGALCSIGVTAATICIFIFGSQQRYKHHHQNQKFRFQIYTDDKVWLSENNHHCLYLIEL